jgi:hypothetical protein
MSSYPMTQTRHIAQKVTFFWELLSVARAMEESAVRVTVKLGGPKIDKSKVGWS